MRRLAGTLKQDPALESNPAKKSTWYLATAIYLHWIGELEKSAGTAGTALRNDPANLDALDYIIDLLRDTHTKDKLAIYKPTLDRWSGGDSSTTYLEPKPLKPKM